MLNNYYFRHTQLFSFSDKSTGPILAFGVLALYKIYSQRLEEMVESQEKPVDERAQFKLPVHMMLRNREIAKTEFENIVDHTMSAAHF